MGYLQKGVCHPTIESARADACSNVFSNYGVGDSFVTVTCTSTDFTQATMTLRSSVNGSFQPAFSSVYPTFPTCDFGTATDDAGDLFALGLGALVLVILAKWVFSIFAPTRHHDAPL